MEEKNANLKEKEEEQISLMKEEEQTEDGEEEKENENSLLLQTAEEEEKEEEEKDEKDEDRVPLMKEEAKEEEKDITDREPTIQKLGEKDEQHDVQKEGLKEGQKEEHNESTMTSNTGEQTPPKRGTITSHDLPPGWEAHISYSGVTYYIDNTGAYQETKPGTVEMEEKNANLQEENEDSPIMQTLSEHVGTEAPVDSMSPVEDIPMQNMTSEEQSSSSSTDDVSHVTHTDPPPCDDTSTRQPATECAVTQGKTGNDASPAQLANSVGCTRIVAGGEEVRQMGYVCCDHYLHLCLPCFRSGCHQGCDVVEELHVSDFSCKCGGSCQVKTPSETQATLRGWLREEADKKRSGLWKEENTAWLQLKAEGCDTQNDIGELDEETREKWMKIQEAITNNDISELDSITNNIENHSLSLLIRTIGLPDQHIPQLGNYTHLIEYGKTLLHYACSKGLEDILTILLSKLDDDLYYSTLQNPDSLGNNLIHAAFRSHDSVSHDSVGLTLLGKLSQLEIKDIICTKNVDDRTPIHEACINGHESTIDSIIGLLDSQGCYDVCNSLVNDQSFSKYCSQDIVMQLYVQSLKDTQGNSFEQMWGWVKMFSIRDKNGHNTFENDNKDTIMGLFDNILNNVKSDENNEKSIKELFPDFVNVDKKSNLKDIVQSHPLTNIGAVQDIALVKHPLIQLYTESCWKGFVRSILCLHIVMYTLFTVCFTSFVCMQPVPFRPSAHLTTFNHSENNVFLFFLTLVTQNDSDLVMSNNASNTQAMSGSGFVMSCGVTALVLSFVLLGYECYQVRVNSGIQYLYKPENWLEIFVYLGSIAVILSYLIDNDWLNELNVEQLHSAGSLLIVIIMFLEMHLLGKYPGKFGRQFRMLLNVIWNIISYAPILIMPIFMYASAFSNILIDDENSAFDNMGLSLAKTMTMSIGEIDYTDVFLDTNSFTLLVLCKYIILVIFVISMPIALMNLLIGVAVGEIQELKKNAEISEFQSRVSLILEYSYMLRKLVGYKQKKTLQQLFVRDPSRWFGICIGVLCMPFCFPVVCVLYLTGNGDCDVWFMDGSVDDAKYKKWKTEYLRKLKVEHEKIDNVNMEIKQLKTDLHIKVNNLETEINGLKTEISGLTSQMSVLINLIKSQSDRKKV